MMCGTDRLAQGMHNEGHASMNAKPGGLVPQSLRLTLKQQSG
jgi:hypothetical protein